MPPPARHRRSRPAPGADPARAARCTKAAHARRLRRSADRPAAARASPSDTYQNRAKRSAAVREVDGERPIVGGLDDRAQVPAAHAAIEAGRPPSPSASMQCTGRRRARRAGSSTQGEQLLLALASVTRPLAPAPQIVPGGVGRPGKSASLRHVRSSTGVRRSAQLRQMQCGLSRERQVGLFSAGRQSHARSSACDRVRRRRFRSRSARNRPQRGRPCSPAIIPVVSWRTGLRDDERRHPPTRWNCRTPRRRLTAGDRGASPTGPARGGGGQMLDDVHGELPDQPDRQASSTWKGAASSARAAMSARSAAPNLPDP